MTVKETAEQMIKCLETNIFNLQIKKEKDLATTNPANESLVKQVNDFYKAELERVEAEKKDWEKVLAIK